MQPISAFNVYTRMQAIPLAVATNDITEDEGSDVEENKVHIRTDARHIHTCHQGDVPFYR
jgi:hypothetical protein